MASDWAVYRLKTTIDDKNIPSRSEQVLIRPGSISLFITICDYGEQKYDDDEQDT